MLEECLTYQLVWTGYPSQLLMKNEDSGFGATCPIQSPICDFVSFNKLNIWNLVISIVISLWTDFEVPLQITKISNEW